MVIIDTSIIIDHLRERGERETPLMSIARTMPRETLCISIITIQELYEGRSTKNTEKEQYLRVTIAPLRVLAYTDEIAQLAGEVARDRTQPIEFADAAIAATAIIHSASLYTLNIKDFRGIEKLELWKQ
ncbi:PIN domain-containing protein [Candidatus Uhrbacteria bacterium]|nr:PIN domain-containing protein [Candidatus Uhrbacteria bacterium]